MPLRPAAVAIAAMVSLLRIGPHPFRVVGLLSEKGAGAFGQEQDRLVRFPDALVRMHALTKASTVGVVLVAVGAAFVLPTANDVTSAIAAALLQILTLPISASLIARATYLAQDIPSRVDAVDELAESRRPGPPRHS